MIKRMWIDTPSVYNDYHDYHGTNVYYDEKSCTAYFLSGKVISIHIPKAYMFHGWKGLRDPDNYEIRFYYDDGTDIVSVPFMNFKEIEFSVEFLSTCKDFGFAVYKNLEKGEQDHCIDLRTYHEALKWVETNGGSIK